ncbi:hypothetical protein ZOD2009_18974 [Haladaptatus paucihalophilus DX253]|uniref:Uncharacterized protein n=1 Tax=Haladaptatus paucihalophilus DX253 TaxID=797209 RepID=E7QYA5_HALPU|nr:hypothetical protein [Haladaptatus paucihalophilus]EFW90571.1 hypothetical protein ZOD2009_18974 [Haladaptatus paucihalophilus DX253]SHK29113.1 hypothetical protein SAMN05444342_1219 [Haladaptatus paucihalophilus DX253]
MSQKDAVRGKLADHPRLLGVLFTLSLLVLQFGTVLAGSGANSGP